MFSQDRIRCGKVVAMNTDRPLTVPPGHALDYRRVGEAWVWCTVLPAPATSETRPMALEPSLRQSETKPKGWWQGDVRWMQSKEDRQPYNLDTMAPALKWTFGILLAVILGAIASRIIHSRAVKGAARTAARAAIFSAVFLPLLKWSGAKR